MALQVATNVRGWVITSLSLLTPANNKERWRAEVPFVVAIAYLAPV